MIKNIVTKNGEIFRTEFTEEFLEMYRGLAISVFTTYFKNMQLTEDDKQDLDGIIFEAFVDYNEENKFSTWLTWQVKGYCSARVARSQAKKRNGGFKVLSFEKTLLETNNFSSTLHGIIASEVDVEGEYIDSELIKFLESKLSGVELKLLAVNLKEIRAIDLADELGTSRQNVNNLNKRFKRRLSALINEFNR